MFRRDNKLARLILFFFIIYIRDINSDKRGKRAIRIVALNPNLKYVYTYLCAYRFVQEYFDIMFVDIRLEKYWDPSYRYQWILCKFYLYFFFIRKYV